MSFLRRMLGTKPSIKKMQEIGDIDGLIETLQHEDWEVRRSAIEALGDLGDSRAVNALLEVLERDVETPEKLAKSLENLGSLMGRIGAEPAEEQQAELKRQQDEIEHRRRVIEKVLAKLGHTVAKRTDVDQT